MKYGMTMEELLTEVQRQSHAKKDYVASTQNDVRLVPMPDFPNGVAVVLQKGQDAEIAETAGEGWPVAELWND